jgi:hypothetical protein
MRAVLAMAFTVLGAPAFAQPATKTLIIAGNDGYGTTTCLAAGEHCGKLIADAMCNGQGYPRAHRFGPAKAEDFTAAIPVSTRESHAFVVECGF